MLTHRKYLLIIDDASKDQTLEDYFNKFDYSIVHYDGLQQLHKLEIQPDAILVNWRLFNEETLTIDRLYRQFQVPLLVISDKANETVCVQMLEEGADDFLVKPLHPRELHARISAINRRVQRVGNQPDQAREVLFFANWRLYPSSRQVFCENNKELQLSAGEYDLLLAFLRQPQVVLSRDFLLQITKHSDLVPFDRRIDVQISRLRQKIETDVRKPALIKTIRNSGYLFTAPVLAIRENLEAK